MAAVAGVVGVANPHQPLFSLGLPGDKVAGEAGPTFAHPVSSRLGDLGTLPCLFFRFSLAFPNEARVK
jgi:hypothetical protein